MPDSARPSLTTRAVSCSAASVSPRASSLHLAFRLAQLLADEALGEAKYVGLAIGPLVGRKAGLSLLREAPLQSLVPRCLPPESPHQPHQHRLHVVTHRLQPSVLLTSQSGASTNETS